MIDAIQEAAEFAIRQRARERRQIQDMSARQFDEACARRGFRRVGFLGYYDIGDGVSVSVLNAGSNRRAQLAYLIQQADRLPKGPPDASTT